MTTRVAAELAIHAQGCLVGNLSSSQLLFWISTKNLEATALDCFLRSSCNPTGFRTIRFGGNYQSVPVAWQYS
jgi:hypothetical protein